MPQDAIYTYLMYHFVHKTENLTTSNGNQLSGIVDGLTEVGIYKNFLAPRIAVFHLKDPIKLSDKKSLEQNITTITGISTDTLRA
jgi:hypothetical protein